MVLHTVKPRASLARFYERVAPNTDEGTPLAQICLSVDAAVVSEPADAARPLRAPLTD